MYNTHILKLLLPLQKWNAYFQCDSFPLVTNEARVHHCCCWSHMYTASKSHSTLPCCIHIH